MDSVWKGIADAAAEHGMDKQTFSDLLNGLWVACGRKYPDETVSRVWYFCLHDLTERQFAAGIQRYLTERSKEFLTVQLIRELSGIQQASEEAAILAWDAAVKAIHTVGSYAVPDFADPAISRTIETLGGWDWFCDQRPDQLRNFVRARFLKSYDAFAKIPRIEPVRLKCLIDRNGDRSTVLRIVCDDRKRIE